MSWLVNLNYYQKNYFIDSNFTKFNFFDLNIMCHNYAIMATSYLIKWKVEFHHDILDFCDNCGYICKNMCFLALKATIGTMEGLHFIIIQNILIRWEENYIEESREQSP